MANTTGVKAASGRGWTIPVPAFPGQICATMSELVAGSALSAATTWDAVDDSAPDGPVARPTTSRRRPARSRSRADAERRICGARIANCARTVVALCSLTATRAFSSLVSAAVAVTVCGDPSGPVAVAGDRTSVSPAGAARRRRR